MPLRKIIPHPPKQQSEPDQYPERLEAQGCLDDGPQAPSGAMKGNLWLSQDDVFSSAFPNYVYAIDLDNYWPHRMEIHAEQDKLAPSVACCDFGEPRYRLCRTARFWMTSLDAKVYALDAKTGQVIWRPKMVIRNWGKR